MEHYSYSYEEVRTYQSHEYFVSLAALLTGTIFTLMTPRHDVSGQIRKEVKNEIKEKKSENFRSL